MTPTDSVGSSTSPLDRTKLLLSLRRLVLADPEEARQVAARLMVRVNRAREEDRQRWEGGEKSARAIHRNRCASRLWSLRKETHSKSKRLELKQQIIRNESEEPRAIAGTWCALDCPAWWMKETLKVAIIAAHNLSPGGNAPQWPEYQTTDALQEMALLILIGSDVKFEPTSVGLPDLGEWTPFLEKRDGDELPKLRGSIVMLAWQHAGATEELYWEFVRAVELDLRGDVPDQSGPSHVSWAALDDPAKLRLVKEATKRTKKANATAVSREVARTFPSLSHETVRTFIKGAKVDGVSLSTWILRSH